MTATTMETDETTTRRKWPTLLTLALAELLAMATWFSASAVVAALTEAWSLGDGGRSWLTMSVQIGFVIGAFGSAVLNLADRIPARWLFAGSAALAGLATALIPLIANGIGVAITLRLLTGIALAGVYPVGMKIMATWTKEDRGLGIGLLVGALIIGNASPHLFNAFGGIGAWQPVLAVAAGSAFAGALLAALFVREGPYGTPSVPFDWGAVGRILRDRDVMLANTGYLGHMWELFAMLTWMQVFLQESYAARGVEAQWASLATFGVIAIGGPASLIAGQLADKVGRTIVTSVMMAMSGAIALSIGLLFKGPVWAITAAVLVWGFVVVADSAQFSASVSELCDPEYTGTALTLQTSMGFLLTLVTIRLVPPLVDLVGWEWAFAFLAIGPAVGIWGMMTLRGSEARVKLAGGRG